MEWTFVAVWVVCWSACQCKQQNVERIQSPRHPQPYPPNLQNRWHVWAPAGFKIQLWFTHLDIRASKDCSLDSLTIERDEKFLSKVCGQKNKTELSDKPVVIEGEEVKLVFQTRDFNPDLHQHTGFSASYVKVDVDECSKVQEKASGPVCSQICVNTVGSYYCSCYSGYKLQADHHTCILSCDERILNKHEGRLSSPRFPHQSPSNLSCTYVLSVEDDFKVTLTFTDFHVYSEDGDDGRECHHHWLQVMVPNKQPMVLCGGRSPGVIATNSSMVRLNYRTDVKGLSRGWSLTYKSLGNGCPNPAPGGIRVKQDHGHVCEAPQPLINGGVTLVSGSRNQHRSVIQYHCNQPFYSFPGGKNGKTAHCVTGTNVFTSLLDDGC
ncbi:unnamed protein product [Tetraodon nigroviridis]|uniref:(spotted green pufferfish) hypothetical protein n=1 Tax=Tetraodon nigroviridis TaxID=99883 RepID=Q4SNE5_TETNG|nr:unnamed protein product [Tetraodon nigroviridis]